MNLIFSFIIPFLTFSLIMILTRSVHLGSIEIVIDFGALIGCSFMFLLHQACRKWSWIAILSVGMANMVLLFFAAFEIMRIVFNDSL